MAVRWAVATGLWSDTATWNGGTLPTSADDVHADGRTVTIDQNVTVLTLRTTARSGGTVGGGFTLNAGFTLNTTTGMNVGTTTVVTIGAGSTNTTINSGSAFGAASASPCIDMVTGSAPLTFTGNINVQFVNNGSTIRLSGTNNSLTMVGSITGVNGATTGNTLQAILVNGTGATVSITGAITAGTSATASNNFCINLGASAGNLTIVGNVTGGNGVGGSVAINSTATSGSVFVTGNVTGGGGTGGIGIQTTGNGASRVVSVVGTVTAGPGSFANGVVDTNTGGGYSQIAGTTIDNSFGDAAFFARRVRVVQTTNTYRQFTNSTGYPSGTPITYGSLDYIPNNVPIPANVRSGTVYGNNQYTGTLAVPPANSVASGVPVDNTTGTAALSPADIAALVGAQVAAAVSSPP